MGWFGFGGSRDRDDRPRGHKRYDERQQFYGRGHVYDAVRIDRAGKPSRLPEDRPRRRDYEDRWSRR
jgi:hypothetical protein